MVFWQRPLDHPYVVCLIPSAARESIGFTVKTMVLCRYMYLAEHVEELYEMYIMGARPYVQRRLQSACTSIIDCDVEQPIHLTSTYYFISLSWIVLSLAYTCSVFVSHLIRFIRASSKYDEFVINTRRLASGLLSQGYAIQRLNLSLRNIIGRYSDLITAYAVPISRMIRYILDDCDFKMAFIQVWYGINKPYRNNHLNCPIPFWRLWRALRANKRLQLFPGIRSHLGILVY